MRTTVRLDGHLLAQAKKHAAESGKTLTSVLEDALRESLSRRITPVITAGSRESSTATNPTAYRNWC